MTLVRNPADNEVLLNSLAPGIKSEDFLVKFNSWPSLHEAAMYPAFLQAYNPLQPDALLSKLELLEHGAKCIRMKGELIFKGKITFVQILWKDPIETYQGLYRRLRNQGKLHVWVSTQWQLWGHSILVIDILPTIMKEPGPHMANYKILAVCILDELQKVHSSSCSFSKVSLSCIAQKQSLYLLTSDIEPFSERRVKRCLEQLFSLLPSGAKDVAQCVEFLSKVDDYDDLSIYGYLKGIILGKEPSKDDTLCNLM